MWAFLRRKNIYFLSENGSSKPSPRISHFQLELDKLPYVITRLKPICHRWNAVSQLGKCLACCTASQRCLKASQSPSYSHLRLTHTPTDIPGLPQLYLEPTAQPLSAFSVILQSLTSISKPSTLLFLTHNSFLFLLLQSAPA